MASTTFLFYPNTVAPRRSKAVVNLQMILAVFDAGNGEVATGCVYDLLDWEVPTSRIL